VFGVACVAVGIGAAGAAWIDRLSRSSWFDGLAPLEADLALSGGQPSGCWTLPTGRFAPAQTADVEVNAFVESGCLPNAAVTTIAVSGEASQADLAVACRLVTALSRQRGPGDHRQTVIVTIEAGNAFASQIYVQKLLDRGAFLIRPGWGATGDDLHDFALRTATMPRGGYRLISVDLLDYLVCWQPGFYAHLHVIPSTVGDAAQALFTIRSRLDQDASSAVALNLHLFRHADETGFFLGEIDRLATLCRETFLQPDGHMVFTHGDRLDRPDGLAELLTVYHVVPSARVSVPVAARAP